MVEKTTTIAETVLEYVAGLPAESRQTHQQELSRFARWFGGDRQPSDLTGQTIETYQQQIENTGADAARRLEPLKSFLTFLQKKGLADQGLSKNIKSKKVSTKRDSKENKNDSRSSTGEEINYLTREGFDQMKAELEHLTTDVRVQVAHDLAEARIDKDIRENAPYDAAKNHQALVEARIRELERIMSSAQVMLTPLSSERVSIGTTVTIKDIALDEELKYTLVNTNEADTRAGKISTASPVGKALIDRSPGDIIEVAAPAGTIHYRIEKIDEVGK
jgi:transcription elongation factor GreA